MSGCPSSAAAAGPLAGCTVIDLSSYVTGPFAAMMLGDLGAEVVKVEPPGGDPNRRIGRRRQGIGLLFANTNRGKRSIVLDLKSPIDRDILLRLLAPADVLVENWRPGVADRLGLDDDTLRTLNPRLVHLAITGYGPDGPRAGEPAFDTLAQAISGLAWLHQGSDGPNLLRTYVADKVTSTYAVQGVLGALLQRERSGAGRRVDVSMLDTSAYFNFPDVFEGRTLLGADDPVDPCDQPGQRTLIRTADGWIVVAPGSRAHIERACRAVGHPEWIGELAALHSFTELAPALMSRLEAVTRTAGTDRWLTAFREADVPAAPVLDLDGHLADPQVVHNRTYGELTQVRIGPHRYARYPIRSGSPPSTGEPPVARRPFPELDEHGDDIRAEAQPSSRERTAVVEDVPEV